MPGEVSAEQRFASLFESVSTSEIEGEEIAHVNGQLPKWLHGTFMRTGPGMFDLGKGFTVNHVFDGYALLTSFVIEEDIVKLKMRYLESEAFKRAILNNKPCVLEFGTRGYPDPSKSLFSRYMPTIIPELSDNGNVNIFNVGKETFTSGELCYFHEINRSTLQSSGKFDSQKYFGCQLLCSHPITDEDGSTYTMGLSFLTGVKYNIIRIPAPAGDQKMKDVIKKNKIIATISSSHHSLLSYIHSFGLTKKYIVFIEQPYLINVPKVLSAAVRKADCLQDWLQWRPDLKCRFIVVDKNSGKLLKTDFFSQDPFFFLHIVNCYEESDQIIIDILELKNLDFVNSLVLEKLRQGKNDLTEESTSRGTRYVIPIVDIKDVPENINLVSVKSTAKAIRKGNQIILSPEICTKYGLEFPTFNRNYVGKKFDYYYVTGSFAKTCFENSVAKVDLKKKETVVWKENEYCVCGEPLFIPRPNGKSEDDGIVLVSVSNLREKGMDYLLCLDATNMKELGRAQFKTRIPQAIHGTFVFSN